MKHCLRLIAMVLSFFFIFSAQAAPVTYVLDPTHTYVLWHVNHFGYSNPSGKWMANGTLQLDQADPQNSKINVTIPMDNLVTGIPKLDEHLKSPTFFDVVKYPTATFVSSKVTVTGKNTANVEGMLTLHGVTKPVTLNVTLNKSAISPLNNKQTAGFSATTELKRSDFGVSAYAPGLSDNVQIEIEAEASPA